MRSHWSPIGCCENDMDTGFIFFFFFENIPFRTLLHVYTLLYIHVLWRAWKYYFLLWKCLSNPLLKTTFINVKKKKEKNRSEYRKFDLTTVDCFTCLKPPIKYVQVRMFSYYFEDLQSAFLKRWNKLWTPKYDHMWNHLLPWAQRYCRGFFFGGGVSLLMFSFSLHGLWLYNNLIFVSTSTNIFLAVCKIRWFTLWNNVK